MPDPREWARDVRRRHDVGAVVLVPALPDRVAAVVRALASADVHRELVVRSGWTAQMYERWLGEALADALR